MPFPPRDPRQNPAFLELEIQDKERKRNFRLAQEDTSIQRNGISSRVSALIALIVVVLLLIVGMIVLFHVL